MVTVTSRLRAWSSLVCIFFAFLCTASRAELFRIRVDQGTSVSFVCPSRSSKHNWRFYRQNPQKNLTSEVIFPSSYSGGGNVLKIPYVQLKSKGWYKCFSNGAPPQESTFRLALHKPEDVQNQNSIFKVLLGESAQLRCHSSLSGVVWTRTLDGNAIQDLPGYRAERRQKERILLIEKTDEAAAGLYYCHSYDLYTTAVKTVKLIVQRRVKLVEELPNTFVAYHGQTILIPCHADGLPAPKVRWSCTNHSENSRWSWDHAGESNASAVLTMTPTAEENCTCEATNNISDVSKGVFIAVKSDHISGVLREERSAAVLEFASPQNVSSIKTWEIYDEKQTHLKNKRYHLQPVKMTGRHSDVYLIIDNLHSSDEGLYFGHAFAAETGLEAVVVQKLLLTGIPLPPQNPTIRNIYNGSYNITWDVQSHPNRMASHFEVRLYKLDLRKGRIDFYFNRSVDNFTTAEVFEIEDSRNCFTYAVQIASRNDHGRSPSVLGQYVEKHQNGKELACSSPLFIRNLSIQFVAIAESTCLHRHNFEAKLELKIYHLLLFYSNKRDEPDFYVHGESMSAKSENLTSANNATKTIIKYQVRLSGLPITEQLEMALKFIEEPNKKIAIGKSCEIQIQQNCQRITDADDIGRVCVSRSAKTVASILLHTLLLIIALLSTHW